MKKVFFAALLALPLLAVPARAQCCCWFPFRLEAGGNVYLRVYNGPLQSGGIQLGPWYQYFPYEAHFQSAAPIGFPYWPSPQTLPPPVQHANPYMQSPPSPAPQPAATQRTSYQTPFFQPVGYSPQPPSYWYQR
jgi:hypothetical protein